MIHNSLSRTNDDSDDIAFIFSNYSYFLGWYHSFISERPPLTDLQDYVDEYLRHFEAVEKKQQDDFEAAVANGPPTDNDGFITVVNRKNHRRAEQQQEASQKKSKTLNSDSAAAPLFPNFYKFQSTERKISRNFLNILSHFL